ncbi:glucose-1-phosphate cytidylyltransferase [Treponema primitia]|uniref:glucose-1-phosphate cytidylyltransferase n=1 Tax=Treponema primitia TaxID=88058 RepID=UPI00025555FA|nr:glucose-1-phosphate cytidylyltransferase [Treponema primitia]
MKVVILAGGFGTRLSEETGLRPKPMVEIGGRPILWHIMKTYSYWGFNEFVILTGYLSHVIKDYFLNYYTRYSDITVDMETNTVEVHQHRNEPWKVTMLYTGPDTMTGGRLLRAQEFLGSERFMLTYGDGVSDVNIPALLASHEKAGKRVTVTAIQPVGKFGSLDIDGGNLVRSFMEKPEDGGTWINGGFFVMEPDIFRYLDDGDKTILERTPLERLAGEGQLNAYKHTGFWKAMDTLNDKNILTGMWTKGEAPWALWIK